MIEYSTVSKIGTRLINEDTIKVLNKNNNFVFTVCDGLGGHKMGDTASRIVADCFESYFKRSENLSENLILEMFDFAQETLLYRKNALHIKNEMCSTAVALTIAGENVYSGYIGDSRLYAFEHGVFKDRTRDHSLAQLLFEQGEISESEINRHSDRNKLIRVMGIPWEKPMYTVLPSVKLKNNQAYLLCTDGFWEWLSVEEMQGALQKSDSAHKWLSLMTETVERNCGLNPMDNYSAIAVINR